MIKKIFLFTTIFISILLITIFLIFRNRLKSSAKFVADFSTGQVSLKETEGRTNILLFGVDTRDKKYLQTGTLTDSIIIASLNFKKMNVRLLSVPRDLWVIYKGRGSKINEVYTLNKNDINSLKDVIQDTLGIQIHYTAQIDFKGFEKLIDTLGGIDINNPYEFTDNFYPKFGWENETCGIDVEKLKKEKEKKGKELSEYDFPCRFETISFKKGLIHLNGEQALKYARSRHSYNINQGTDFARAKRQHLVITAVKDKLLKSENILNPNKFRELYANFTKMIKTDVPISTVIAIIPQINKEDIANIKIDSAVLSDRGTFEEGGILVRGDPNKYGGRYVLVPKQEDSIKSFVSYYFYSQNLKQEPTKE